MVLSLNGKRGKKETFPYGDDSLSITELLRKPEVVNFIERNGPLTYASKSEKLRKLLRNGMQHRIHRRCKFKTIVMEHNDQEPTFQGEQEMDACYLDRNHHRELGDQKVLSLLMAKDLQLVKCWNAILSFTTIFKEVNSSRKNTYMQSYGRK